jgi:hypothetical protein
MNRTRGALVLSVLAAAGAAVGIASATHGVRRTDGVIHACRAKNGTLRVVDAGSARGACRARPDQRDQRDPRGLRGLRGLPGRQDPRAHRARPGRRA